MNGTIYIPSTQNVSPVPTPHVFNGSDLGKCSCIVSLNL